jgi:hypothetical protein
MLAQRQHADLPSVTLRNMDRRPVAPRKHRAGLTLAGTPSLAGRPNRVVEPIQVSGLAVDEVGNRPPRESVCLSFLNALSPSEIPPGANRTASSAKGGATAVESFLLYASFSFSRSSLKTRKPWRSRGDPAAVETGFLPVGKRR